MSRARSSKRHWCVCVYVCVRVCVCVCVQSSSPQAAFLGRRPHRESLVHWCVGVCVCDSVCVLFRLIFPGSSTICFTAVVMGAIACRCGWSSDAHGAWMQGCVGREVTRKCAGTTWKLFTRENLNLGFGWSEGKVLWRVCPLRRVQIFGQWGVSPPAGHSGIGIRPPTQIRP